MSILNYKIKLKKFTNNERNKIIMIWQIYLRQKSDQASVGQSRCVLPMVGEYAKKFAPENKKQ